MNRGPIIVLHFVDTHRRGGVEEQMLTLLTHLNRTLFLPMLIAPPELIEKDAPGSAVRWGGNRTHASYHRSSSLGLEALAPAKG